jgi:hypothetical protein
MTSSHSKTDSEDDDALSCLLSLSADTVGEAEKVGDAEATATTALNEEDVERKTTFHPPTLGAVAKTQQKSTAGNGKNSEKSNEKTVGTGNAATKIRSNNSARDRRTAKLPEPSNNPQLSRDGGKVAFVNPIQPATAPSGATLKLEDGVERFSQLRVK